MVLVYSTRGLGKHTGFLKRVGVQDGIVNTNTDAGALIMRVVFGLLKGG